MAYGAAKHSRRKIERLVSPKGTSAPWLTRVTSVSRGMGHKYGNMHFTIYRSKEHSIGPGPMHLGKNPYSAKVCIGKPHRGKDRAAGYMRSSFTSQTGDTVGCEWGSGKTPTKALARATSNLGRRLARAKRGR